MSLRVRLTLFFAGIVVLPLGGAAVVLQSVVGQAVDERADTRLESASAAVATVWADRLDRVERETDRAARDLGAAPPGSADLDERLDAAREEADLDFLVLGDRLGAVVAAATVPADFASGVTPPRPPDVLAEGPVPGVLRARVSVEGGGAVGTAAGGWFVDEGFLRDLAGVARVDLALRSDGRTLAATAPLPQDLPSAGSGVSDVTGDRRAVAAPIGGEQGAIVLVTRDPGTGLSLPIWGVAGLGLAAASLLGILLAGLVARPVMQLSEAAGRITAGDLSVRVPPGGRGDVGRLAQSFNQMADSLEGHVHRLEESRDELRRNLERMGATLRSTLDMEGMFAVILDTAVATLGASSGALYLVGTRRDLRMQVWQGYEPGAKVVRAGEGIAGWAAVEERPVIATEGRDDPSPAEEVEPEEPTAIAVPLTRGERTIGVLALYGRTLPGPFAREDEETLASFAAQASVAIENVLLHREAQRLSITDGLTGVWNRRYLQMELTKEIDRAQRFGRPFSLLVVDIDRFKRVNDEHGHLVGDEVLVEVSRRLVGSLRTTIDLVARFGGEEFVAVLPETPPEGGRVVAEKIRTAIGGEPIPVDGLPAPLEVTVSVGVASFPRDAGSADDLMAAADQAMYRAKEAGRNRVEVAEAGRPTPPEPIEKAHDRRRRAG